MFRRFQVARRILSVNISAKLCQNLQTNHILHGSALDQLKTLESESVDCCITSPPYWALRDYKTEGQLGLEPTFQEYITKLIEIFNQVKRVLKKEGSCWVNIGDTYSQGDTISNRYGLSGSTLDAPIKHKADHFSRKIIQPIAQKSLCLIPQRFQIAMVDQGWICRNTIIWYKPNCMPSSAKDRFTVDFEYLFFFVKSQKYYFETQYEPHESSEEKYNSSKKKWLDEQGKYDNKTNPWHDFGNSKPFINPQNPLGRIKRCVWKIPTQPFSEAHFAVFPPTLVETPLKACCPVNGCVLDPFFGSGTTGLVAMQNARNFVGIELNADYIKMANKRLEPYTQQTRLA